MDGWLANVRREHYLLSCRDDKGLKTLRDEMAGRRSGIEAERTLWAQHVYEALVRPRDELQQAAATAAREAAELFGEPQLDVRKYLGAQRTARDAEDAVRQAGHARRVYLVPQPKAKQPDKKSKQPAKKGGATSDLASPVADADAFEAAEAAGTEAAEAAGTEAAEAAGTGTVNDAPAVEDVKVIEITMPASLAEKKGMDKRHDDEDFADEDDYVLFDKPASDDGEAFSEVALDEDDDDDEDGVRAVDVGADKNGMLSFVKVG